MKVVSIDVADPGAGLGPLRLDRLGDVVVLAGANGSGKSRILDLVIRFCSNAFLPSDIQERETRIADIETSIESWKATLTRPDLDPRQKMQLEEASERGLQEISQFREQLDLRKSVTFDSTDTKPVPVSFTVTTLGLESWEDLTHADVKQRAKQAADANGPEIISRAGISAVHTLYRRQIFLRNKSEKSADDTALIKKGEQELISLNSLMVELVGEPVGWDEDGGPTLFGFPMADRNLSAGQKVLAQIALALFLQNGDRKDLIIFLDEPENHLHGAALLASINRIRVACPKAQLWIATHSVPLIAGLKSRDLFFVDNGSATRVGRTATKVLETLLGGANGVSDLQLFLAHPAVLAAVGFAAECLTPPNVVETNPGDPQTSQIFDVISKHCASGRALRVLDFGAGKGRLLGELAHRCGDDLSTRFDYFAFDANPDAACVEKINQFYEDGAQRRMISGDVGELVDRINKNSVDVLILCNVLHEIDPAEWTKFFGPNGAMTGLLAEDGFLLIVEDQVLRVGESAHQFNFLVLDAPQIRKLFGVSAEDGSFVTQNHKGAKYAERLKAHLIPARFVKDFDRDKLGAALQSLESLSERKSNQLREGPGALAEGGQNRALEYAFWTQQHFNAAQALKKMF